MNKELVKNIVKTFGFGTCLLGAYMANADRCKNDLYYSHTKARNLCRERQAWRKRIDKFTQKMVQNMMPILSLR